MPVRLYLEGNTSTLRSYCLSCIGAQIHDHLMQAGRIHLDHHVGMFNLTGNDNVGLNRCLQQMRHFLDNLVHPHGNRLA